ncbi:MAG: hypothetical protein R6U26_02130 [Candidatus Undinarchaeales archaeon]
MGIVDIRFTKLDAKREKPKGKVDKKGVKIKSNTKVVEIKKKKLPSIGDAVLVDFEYKVNYEPSFGKITVGGSLIYHDKNLKNKIKEDKEDGVQLEKSAYVEVQNAILKSGSVQAMVLAKELQLPAPIQLPTVVENNEKEEKGKKGYA